LILYVIGQLGADGATYKGIEFTGNAVKEISVEGRMTLCNMVVEMGAKNGIITPDNKTAKYLQLRGRTARQFIEDDSDPSYEQVFEYDATTLEPMVSLPPSVDNVKPVSEVASIEVDQALVGSCTNGRIEDLRIAAEVVRHKRIHKNVRALVIPASQEVYLNAIKEGLLKTFVKAGFLVGNPNCGPCYGGHLGLLADGEVCISSTNRNFVGRMGSPKAEIFLASPATVAASAITGKITDPRSLEV
jgi:3-isopropylmalate/(R)-2-methylmalate dehydratase large subunit